MNHEKSLQSTFRVLFCSQEIGGAKKQGCTKKFSPTDLAQLN